MRRHFYVYTLSDPRTGKPFYVGKGCGRRYLEHEREAAKGKGCNPAKASAILALWAAGLEVQYTFLASELSEEEALSLEREMIQQYGLANLTNIAPGSIDYRTKEKLECERMLKRLIPFDEWCAKQGPTEFEMGLYCSIVKELERGARGEWETRFELSTVHG